MSHDFVLHARQRNDKTEAILDAAMQLAAAGGLETLTLSRVAASLGVVTTALYRYFPSKDALLAALQRRAVVALHARYMASLEPLTRQAPSRASVEARVAAVVPLLATGRFYIALPTTEPRISSERGVVARLLATPGVPIPDEEVAAAIPLVASFLQAVGTRVDAAVKAGALEPGDPAQRTLTLWAAFHGLTQLSKLQRLTPTVSTEPLADASARALLRGWGAQDDVLDQAQQALARAIKKRTFVP
jgi:AcrR family transcriptional regulator